jgi:hypothetical protein
MLDLSMGPNRVGFSHPHLESQTSNFRNAVFSISVFSIPGDKVQKPNDPSVLYIIVRTLQIQELVPFGAAVSTSAVSFEMCSTVHYFCNTPFITKVDCLTSS